MVTDTTILVFFLFPLSLANPEVQTMFGQVKGISYTLRSGRSANIFYGIPYAKPPVGELRFEKPLVPEPWSGTRDCTQPAAGCSALLKTAEMARTSEDCLTLDIIAPAEKPPRPLPVLFHIHGGGYEMGTTAIFNLTSIADLYIDKGVIIVFIQYRLGMFGFFTTGRSDMPGNVGLFDQAQALDFVHSNIEAFGGDPARIIAWGMSAGGASSSQLSLSPYTRDKLAGTIEISGSAWNAWSHRSPTVATSRLLATALGCSWDHGDLKECMKTKTVEEIQTAMSGVPHPTAGFAFLLFTPRIDDDFFPSTMDELAAEAPKMPRIIGLNNKESALFTILGLVKSIHDSQIPVAKQAEYDEDDLKKYIHKVISTGNHFGDCSADVEAKILAHYTRQKPTKPDNAYYLDVHTDLSSDLVFNMGIHRGADVRARLDRGPSFVYLFEHYAPDLYKPGNPVNGSFHLNEMAYMLDVFLVGKFEWTEKEAEIRRETIQMIASFAHNLKPSTDTLPEWPEYTTKETAYVAITSGGTQKRSGFFAESAGFWKEIELQYEFDPITELRKTHDNAHSEL